LELTHFVTLISRVVIHPSIHPSIHVDFSEINMNTSSCICQVFFVVIITLSIHYSFTFDSRLKTYCSTSFPTLIDCYPGLPSWIIRLNHTTSALDIVQFVRLCRHSVVGVLFQTQWETSVSTHWRSTHSCRHRSFRTTCHYLLNTVA